MAGTNSPGGGILEALFQIFADIVTDARHKVVEESWFGRQVTDIAPPAAAPGVAPPSPDDRDPLGRTMPRETFAQRCDALEQEHHRSATIEPPSPDRGIDL